MSITRGGITRGGITSGGILRSQQGQQENPYAFNFDLSTLKDKVTGKSLTTVISGTRYDEVNGVVTAFGSNVPTVTERGLRTVGSYTNLVKYSEDLSQAATWVKFNSVSIIPDVEQWIDGNTKMDSVDLNSNALARIYQDIATVSGSNIHISGYMKSTTIPGTFPMSVLVPVQSGNLYNITMNTERIVIFAGVTNTSETTVYIGNRRDFGTGATLLSLVGCGYQATYSKYALPYVPTTSSAVSSPSEAGSADNGNKFNNLATDFPALKTALESKGTLTLNWTPGFSKADVAGVLNILSFDSSTNHLRYDATAGALELYDGTNIASVALDCVANTAYAIKATWEGSSMKLWVGTTAGTVGTFAGSFATDDMVIGLNNNELQYVKDLKVLKQPNWDTPS